MLYFLPAELQKINDEWVSAIFTVGDLNNTPAKVTSADTAVLIIPTKAIEVPSNRAFPGYYSRKLMGGNTI
jgi:hypothetical protein